MLSLLIVKKTPGGRGFLNHRGRRTLRFTETLCNFVSSGLRGSNRCQEATRKTNHHFFRFSLFADQKPPMKTFSTLIILMVSAYANAQVICGTADENGIVTLTAPPGNVFTSIQFASYGTPNGSCGSFTIGTCHAPNSVSICSSVFVGNNSASISASNGVFGDPCGGTFKRLYIEASYSIVLPLRLISFTAKKIEENKVRLDWVSDHEMNTSHFVIERSEDGVSFEETGSVTATGSGGRNYSFMNTIPGATPTYYYRLKMVDRDGKYQYSNIVRIYNNSAHAGLSVFPVPADKFITVLCDQQQEAFIINSTGRPIKKILLIKGSVTITIAGFNPGIYFIKTGEGVIKFIKK